MNVNMLQSQENNLQKFSRQIRARKQSEENKVIEPFKSHRKRLEESSVLMPLPQNEENKNNDEIQKYKLLREYPQQSAINATDNKKKVERFKYDFNHLTHSVTKEQVPAKATSNISGFESNTLFNRYSTGIKRNTNESSYLISNISSRIPRNQVKSIIFDSKVEPFQSRYSTPGSKDLEIQNDREINMFKEKVDRVNNQIEAGISNLQKMIQRLKQRKISQSILKSKAAQVKLQKIAESQMVKVENTPQIQKRNMDLEQNQQNQLPKVQVKQENADFTKKYAKKQEKQLPPSCSQMELNGDYKSKLGKFPPEYTTFINRLAHQIQIDMQFTNMISDLTKNSQLPKIKGLIMSELKKYQTEIDVNQSFFQIEPSEIDPLEVCKPYFIIKMKEEEQSELSMKIYGKYKEIQTHFQTKLKQKFNVSIIRLLFEELAKFNSTKVVQDLKTVTIGHLLSYLNMRTNRSFRNRYFVKMIKRLQLKPNTNLTSDSFQRLISMI